MNEPAQSNTNDQAVRRRARRNWALLAALVGFVVLVYVITIIKMTVKPG